jgi:hypothetical protein
VRGGRPVFSSLFFLFLPFLLLVRAVGVGFVLRSAGTDDMTCS